MELTCTCQFCQADTHDWTPLVESLEARISDLEAILERILYCQLGGHFNPDDQAKSVLDEARAILSVSSDEK